MNPQWILDPKYGKTLRLIVMGVASVLTFVQLAADKLEDANWTVSLPFVAWLIQAVANWTPFGNKPPSE